MVAAGLGEGAGFGGTATYFLGGAWAFYCGFAVVAFLASTYFFDFSSTYFGLGSTLDFLISLPSTFSDADLEPISDKSYFGCSSIGCLFYCFLSVA